MAENLIVEIVKLTPPITRILAAGILATCFLVYMEIVSPYKLIVTRACIRRMELHRILTSFLYFGAPNLDTILHVIFLIRYSKMLEESFINTSDYVYFLVVVQALIFAIALAWDIMILGPVLSSVIIYVWTRKNPNVQIQLFGCFVFPAFYLPFILPLFSLVSERKILKNEILGIFVGHFYYFFKFVFPMFGYNPLCTPAFFQKLFGEYDAGAQRVGARRGDRVRLAVLEDVVTAQPRSDSPAIENMEQAPAPKNASLTEGRSGARTQRSKEDATAAGSSADCEFYEKSVSYEVENSTMRDAQTDANDSSGTSCDSLWDPALQNDASTEDTRSRSRAKDD